MFASLKGKTVIVTGASKGIGRGIARRFGEAGLNVLVVSRNLAEAERVAAEIGPSASAFAADVANPEDCAGMAAAALERYGQIDVLCANAGIFPAAKLGDMTAADFDHVIGTNLKGTFLSVSAVLPEMKADEVRAHRHHLVDHRPDHGLSRLVALRRVEGGPARLHAHGGDRTGALEHHRQCRHARQHPHGRHGRARPRLHRLDGGLDPDEAAGHVSPTSPMRRCSSPRRRRATSPASRW